MDALVMCGGRGSRLGRGEKPLVEIGGRAMVDRVIDALSPVADTVYAAPSPRTPRTRARLTGRVPVIDTPGEGYVADLSRALSRVEQPVVTATADLPLLRPADVSAVLAAYEEGSLAACVPVERKRALGASVDTSFEYDGRGVAPSGLNVVGEGADRVWVGDRTGLAVNVNRLRDLRIACVVGSERF